LQIRGSTKAYRPKPHLLLFFGQRDRRWAFLPLLLLLVLLFLLLFDLIFCFILDLSGHIGLHGGCTLCLCFLLILDFGLSWNLP